MTTQIIYRQKNTNPWIEAIRPKTLMASLTPIFIGLSFAYYYTSKINVSIAFVTLICTALLQIAANLINDYVDGVKGVDNHKRLGPTRVTASGLIPKQQVRSAYLICLIASFTLGLLLMFHGGLPITIIGITSMLFAYGYTGGPYPLSYRALGEILAFIYFGPIAVWGTYYLQTKDFDHTFSVLVVGIIPGVLASALMSINNLRDRENDLENHKKTIANKLTDHQARLFSFAHYIISMGVGLLLITIFNNKLLLLTLPLYIAFHSSFKQILTITNKKQLNPLLGKTALYMVFNTFILCLVGISGPNE